MEEGLAKRKQQVSQSQDTEADMTLKEFRRPRDAILCVVAEYYSHCSVRVRQLRKMLADPSVRSPELLDHKAHTVGYTLIELNRKE